MSIEHTRLKISPGKKGAFLVELGDKSDEMSYQRAFTLGHTFLQAERFDLAHTVFRELARVRGRGGRAKIMLARCKAELESFEACNEILESFFDGEDTPVGKALESAFVFHTMGLRDEAINEMLKVVRGFPDFPTAFLYLGDLYLERDNFEKAAYCWKFAIKRDRKNGAVAVAARKQLMQLAEQIKKNTKAEKANKAKRASKESGPSVKSKAKSPSSKQKPRNKRNSTRKTKR